MGSVPTFQLMLVFAVVTFGLFRAYLRMQARDERENALETWPAQNGFESSYQPTGSTPTLEADNGHAGPCFAVPVGEQEAAMFAFSYTIGSGRDQVDVETTLVQAVLAAGFPHFRVLPAHADRLPPGPGDEHEVQLESIEFQHAHRLLAARGGDLDALMRLFDPEMIVWWLDQGSLAPIVEYQMGTLVVRSTVPLDESAQYDMLLAHAQKIATGVLAQGSLHRAPIS